MLPSERTFPVMYGERDNAGPTTIPWSVADRAYSVYGARYGRSQSLERLAERGGFYASGQPAPSTEPEEDDRCTGYNGCNDCGGPDYGDGYEALRHERGY